MTSIQMDCGHKISDQTQQEGKNTENVCKWSVQNKQTKGGGAPPGQVAERI